MEDTEESFTYVTVDGIEFPFLGRVRYQLRNELGLRI
jgi:hypothetical protein